MDYGQKMFYFKISRKSKEKKVLYENCHKKEKLSIRKRSSTQRNEEGFPIFAWTELQQKTIAKPDVLSSIDTTGIRI